MTPVTVGRCRLCNRTRELQKSHLLPAAVYRMLRSDVGPVTDPISIRNDPRIRSFRVFQTSMQITGDVLCWTCEQILNVNGEEWVLPQLSTAGGFPLYEQLTAIAPEGTFEDVALYPAAKAPEIRTDFLAHFAVGIFWKAAVHNWETGQGTVRLELGPYVAHLAEFLVGGKFPLDAYLMVTMVPPTMPTISAYLPRTQRIAGLHLHSFYVPGIEFMLTLGKEIPIFLRETCIISNARRPILVAKFPAEFIGKNFADAFERGHIAPKVAERLRRIR